jgi:hypothetical protein
VEQLVGEGLDVVVVLVDGTRARHQATYRPDEVAQALGVEVRGPVADDVAAAARLSREPGCLAPLRGSALVRSTIPVAKAVFARLGPQPSPASAWQSYEVVVP